MSSYGSCGASSPPPLLLRHPRASRAPLFRPRCRRISGLGEPVVAVGLGVPRADVFDPRLVRYLLVVATPAEVRVYAVTFGPAPGLADAGGPSSSRDASCFVATGSSGGGTTGSSSSIHGRLHLHETALVFPTGGFVAQKIVGSASGRIFLAGGQ